MAILLRSSRASTGPKPIENGRKDSAVELKPADSKEASVSTFELPKIPTSDSSQAGPRLVKRSALKPQKQKKTLLKLVSSACQSSCSLILRRSVRSEGMNLLVTDPAVVDLLLVLACASCMRDIHMKGLALLPGACPVKESKIQKLVDEIPALDDRTILAAKAATPWSPAANFASGLRSSHISLLRYLLHSAFANLTSLSPQHAHLKFPSLSLISNLPFPPATFLVARQPHSKEALFRAHAARPDHIRVPVFHGTHPCRLPLILSQGLRNMSGTRFQKHGKCMGSGIYLAKEAQTSLSYAYAIDPWKGSRFRAPVPPQKSEAALPWSQAKILLGCEVVIPVEKQDAGVIVEKDEGRVVVRFLWVLPGDCYAMDRGFEREVQEAMVALMKMRGEVS